MKTKHQLQAIALVVALPMLTSCGEQKTDNTTDTAASEEQAVKPYPLDVCIVSGKKLGSMGEPHVFVHNGQQIKMCCDHCMPKFNKDPEKYLAKLKTTDHSGHQH